VDDVILFNADGEVTESTVANVAVEVAGALVTPPVRCGLLAGTLRAQMLEEGRLREGVLRLEHLRRSPRLVLINSVRGVCRAYLADQ
jgi:para-aminobenzoate synthetase/4-amino-4-deoxychorismate lyase